MESIPINKIMIFVWIGIAVAFFIGEMATEGFVMLWFAVGAVLSMVLAILNVPLWIQLVAFIVASLALFAITRPFFKRMTRKSESSDIASDRTIGKTGVVIELIDPATGKGRVRVESEEWKAENIEDKTIEPGTKIEVVRVEGVHLVVKLKEE